MAALLAAMSISVSYSQTAPQTSPKTSPTDQELATVVNRHYNTLKSLRVNFIQSYDGLGMQRKESGSLILKKPGRMRWNYSQPPGKLFLLDGKYAYFYAPGQAQATRMPAKELDDLRSPLRFLLGHTQLEKELGDLKITPAGGGRYLLSGVPKGMEKRISRLTLEVSEDGVIHAMKIEEQDGAITQFSFTGEEVNIPVSDQDFVFTPPPGVKIIDGTPPV
jgi:outer membrane lipoprotein carrier protein